MVGIWLNHDDIFHLQDEKREHFECLKQFGFTDAFVLIKGCKYDHGSMSEKHAWLNSVFCSLRRQSIRVHGVFYCSEDWQYAEMYPDKTDVTILGKYSKRRISHISSHYVDYLVNSIVTATREYELDGIQLDFVRYGVIGNGWSQEEENVYNSFGVDVPKLKGEILARYDESKPDCNVDPILKRYTQNDEQLIALATGRRSIISGFLHTVTDRIHNELPGRELSAAVMPETLYNPWRYKADLHYGQDFEDFVHHVDRLFPMVYTGTFNMSSEWAGKVAKNAIECLPKTVIGIDCIEPKTNAGICADIKAIQGQKKTDLCFFRYGRMVLAVREGHNTILYNTYPGTVTQLILNDGKKELKKECEVKSGSCICVPGHWEYIRAFGSFTIDKDHQYDGELCVLEKERVQ